MLIYSLFSVNILISMLSSILNKRFQLGFQADTIHFVCYNFFNALLASVNFFVSTGFSLEMNMITFLYSVLFALIVFLSLVLSILSLFRVTIALCSITSTAGSIVLSALFGIVFLNEDFSLRLLFAIVFMLTAILIPYFKLWNSGKQSNIPICIALFFISGASVIVQKLYTLTPDVCDANSFFLMTNLLLTGICGIILGIMLLIRPKTRNQILHAFSLKQLGNISARTILSNLGSVITIILLKNMNVSVYTIISSAIGVISAAVLSAWYFREHMPRENWIAVLCSICAILVSPQK